MLTRAIACLAFPERPMCLFEIGATTSSMTRTNTSRPAPNTYRTASRQHMKDLQGMPLSLPRLAPLGAPAADGLPPIRVVHHLHVAELEWKRHGVGQVAWWRELPHCVGHAEAPADMQSVEAVLRCCCSEGFHNLLTTGRFRAKSATQKKS